MPRHPLCPEDNRFKISGNGLDLFNRYEGIEPRSFSAVYYDHEDVPIYGGSFVASPVKWILGHLQGRATLTSRYSITLAHDGGGYCVAPDTGEDNTYLLEIGEVHRDRKA